MNDSFRTNVFVRFNPETIACACIYLAARQLQIPLPNNPHWFLLFGIKEQDIRRICLSILQLYTRSKPNADELERLVGEIKKRHIEAKLKAKELAAAQGATPNSTSAPNTPEKFGLSPSIVKKRTEHEKLDSGADRKDQSLGTRRKRSRSRSRSRSDVKKARSDDSGEHKSYNSSSRSRSRSPKSKGRQQQQQQQHGRHVSKKEDYVSYSRQKQVKYEDKYNSSSSNNRDWKKRKSGNSNSRSETTATIELSKYSKYTSHDSSKKDRYQKLDAKSDDKYEKRTTKYTREDVSPPTNARAYSSSPDRLTAAKKKNKHKSKGSLPDERTDSKKRNGQSRLGHSNHHHVPR